MRYKELWDAIKNGEQGRAASTVFDHNKQRFSSMKDFMEKMEQKMRSEEKANKIGFTCDMCIIVDKSLCRKCKMGMIKVVEES